jgi:hypothetical protein
VEQIATWIGYVWMAAGGVALTAVALALSVYLLNAAVNDAARTLGGYAEYKRFREWKERESNIR